MAAHARTLVSRLQRQDAAPGYAAQEPVRRQHPEADPGPRALAQAQGADRRPADARGGYRRDASTSTSACSSSATAGTAILLISEDLDEIRTLSDRIAVMYEGRIMGIVERDQATVEQIGLMMAGVSMDEALQRTS